MKKCDVCGAETREKLERIIDTKWVMETNEHGVRVPLHHLDGVRDICLNCKAAIIEARKAAGEFRTAIVDAIDHHVVRAEIASIRQRKKTEKTD